MANMISLCDFWKKLDSDLSVESFPLLPCPACGEVSLELVSDELSIKEMKNQYSFDDFDKINFDENFILGAIVAVAKIADNAQYTQSRFSGFLECSSCGDFVSLMGKAKVPTLHARNRSPYLRTKLMPEFFSPALPIMELLNEYPKTVKAELVKSFSTYFSDASQSAGRVRLAVEMLMDDVGVDKYRLDKSGRVKLASSGKKLKLSLNERLVKFSEVREDLSEMLFAIKAIGNEASHNSGIDHDDLLDAFDVLRYVLEELYLRTKIRKKLLKTTSNLSKKYT